MSILKINTKIFSEENMKFNRLPLFYYPTTWIYVDDDKNMLKSMEYVLSEFNSVKLFTSPIECLDFIKNHKNPLENYSFLESITTDENHGVLHHTPIDFDLSTLVNILDNTARHEEITAMIIDYNMQKIDGLSLAEQCYHFPAKKLLLTGKAKDNDAIDGFNRNLINRYLQKFGEDMEENLVSYLQSLTLQYFQDVTSSLFSYLETENKLPLSDPIFIDFFKKYCEQNKIEEYCLVDKQGSLLCINEKKEKSCFIMYSEKGIDSWVSSYLTDSVIFSDELCSIKSKKMVPFFGIGKEAWQVETNSWSKNLYPANTLDGREKYFWTVVNL